MIRRILRRLAASLILLIAVAVAVLLARRAVVPPIRYVCPLLNAQALTQTSEIATCTDCTYYPVDKSHSLSATYTPVVYNTGLPGGGKMTASAVGALQALFGDAQRFGIRPVVTSAYRSYDEQVTTFVSWTINEWGNTFWFTPALEAAQRYSAWPGHSEHQLGTAVDLNCQGCAAFDRDDERNLSLWRYLEENAHRFGFVISYPRDSEARTGYQYEPWHIRYIGAAYATELFEQGYTRGAGANGSNGSGICALALLRAKHRY